MATDRPEPGDFLELAQRMLRELFGDLRGDPPPSDEEPWAAVTRRPLDSGTRHREPSAQEQRENLTFALATRGVEALEDIALNLAAIRQRLERRDENQGQRPDE